MNKARFTLAQLNAMTRAEFVCVVGPVFEHSPWIAEAAWPARPFASAEQLHSTLCRTVTKAPSEHQVALIAAHPDLVGRAALQGTLLTPESKGEQASAGLDTLSAEEIIAFQKSNAAYCEKFGFPFVICARLNKKEAILAGFGIRLNNTREDEIQTALGEIYKIAQLRLRDLIST